MKRGWILTLLLGVMAACSGPPQQGDFVGPDIREFLTVNGYPAVRLGNGEVKLLGKPEETQWYLDRFPPPATSEPAVLRPQSLPAAVDLTPFKTPVKDQGAGHLHGLCGGGCPRGGLHKRTYGLTLDLSEEFLNWQDKVNVLDPHSSCTPQPVRELPGHLGRGQRELQAPEHHEGAAGHPSGRPGPIQRKQQV